MNFERNNRQPLYDYIKNNDFLDIQSILKTFNLLELGALLLNHNMQSQVIKDCRSFYDSCTSESAKRLEELNADMENLNKKVKFDASNMVSSELANIIETSSRLRFEYKQEIIGFIAELED